MSRIINHGTRFDRDYPVNLTVLNTNSDGVTTQQFAMETDPTIHTVARNVAEYINSSSIYPAMSPVRE